MPTITQPDFVTPTPEQSTLPGMEMLFREAKLRERRRRLAWFGAALVVVAAGALGLGMKSNAIGSPPKVPGAITVSVAKSVTTKILTCAGISAIKPSNFVITCADSNTELTQTHWSTWTASGATGTTRFAMNLCKPYCAASPMSYFPDSVVRLSAPETTKHGTFFSMLLVTYKLHGKVTKYSFSWKDDPSF
jgi:hypothetical protein